MAEALMLHFTYQTKNHVNGIEDTSKMNKASIGIARSEKTIAQIKATMTGKTYSPERCKAMSEGKLRANRLKTK